MLKRPFKHLEAVQYQISQTSIIGIKSVHSDLVTSLSMCLCIYMSEKKLTFSPLEVSSLLQSTFDNLDNALKGFSNYNYTLNSFQSFEIPQTLPQFPWDWSYWRHCQWAGAKKYSQPTFLVWDFPPLFFSPPTTCVVFAACGVNWNWTVLSTPGNMNHHSQDCSVMSGIPTTKWNWKVQKKNNSN